MSLPGHAIPPPTPSSSWPCSNAAVAVVASLALAASASAAGSLFIRGGGFGHEPVRLLMDTRFTAAATAGILAHYYHATKLGTVDSNRRVRVLLGISEASFAGASGPGPVAVSGAVK